MSHFNLDTLSAHGIVARYVVECRKKGHFLPYTDHEVIDSWLVVEEDPDKILLILSEILPKYFLNKAEQPTPKPLSGINTTVTKHLVETKSLAEQ